MARPVVRVAGTVLGGADRHGLLGRASQFAYSAFIGTVPVLFVLVSLIGIFASSVDYEALVAEYADRLPDDVQSLVVQLLDAATRDNQAVVFLVIGAAAGVWQAGNVISIVLDGLNDAHGVQGAPWVRRRLITLALALVVSVAAIVATLALVGSARAAGGFARLVGADADGGELVQTVTLWVGRGALVLGLLLLYRMAPRRPAARWGPAAAGAVLAGGGWLAATGLFALYVDNFARYNVVYGSLAAIVVYLTFLWMTGATLLLGGELTAALEGQGARSAASPEAPAAVAATAVTAAPLDPATSASARAITVWAVGLLGALLLVVTLVWLAAGPSAAALALLLAALVTVTGVVLNARRIAVALGTPAGGAPPAPSGGPAGREEPSGSPPGSGPH
jgi:membrane protein